MKKVSIILIIILALSFYRAIKETLISSTNAHGLISLVTVPKEQYVYNPYSTENSGFVTPSMAEWILKNMEYPYSGCEYPNAKFKDLCNIPLIMFTCSGVNLGDNQSAVSTLGVVKYFINKGYPVDEVYNGVTALQEAVMKNIPKCVSLLLENGADPLITVKAKHKLANGKNSFELHEILYTRGKDRAERNEIESILNKYKNHQTSSVNNNIPSKETKPLKSPNLQSKIKNWNNTNFCSQMSQSKTILLLPVHIKKKLNVSAISGVEIVNCTDQSYMLAGKSKNILLTLEKESRNGSWKREWNLTKYICKKRRAWSLNSKESWNLYGFTNSRSEKTSKYRFSLQVGDGERIYSREFKESLNIPINAINKLNNCNEFG